MAYICTRNQMVIVAQLVRASDCGSEGRGFETHHSPLNNESLCDIKHRLFYWVQHRYNICCYLLVNKEYGLCILKNNIH